MDTEVTLEQLYLRAAKRLHVVEINEPLSAEDRQTIADAYPGIYAMLEVRGLVQWGEADPIPQRYALQVRDLLAEMVAGDFGKTFDAAWAIPELSRAVAPDYRYDETVFEDF